MTCNAVASSEARIGTELSVIHAEKQTSMEGGILPKQNSNHYHATWPTWDMANLGQAQFASVANLGQAQFAIGDRHKPIGRTKNCPLHGSRGYSPAVEC